MTTGLNWQTFVYLTRHGITDVTAWRHAIDASSAPEHAVMIAVLDAVNRLDADPDRLKTLARVIIGLADNAAGLLDYILESREAITISDSGNGSERPPSPSVVETLDNLYQPVDLP